VSSFFRRLAGNIGDLTESNRGIGEGIANQSSLLSEKFAELIAGSNNQQSILNDKLGLIVEALDNQQRIMNDKLGSIVESLDNEQRIMNDKLGSIVESLDNEQRIMNDKLTEMIKNQENYYFDKIDKISRIIDILNNDELVRLATASLTQQKIPEARLDRLIVGQIAVSKAAVSEFPAYGKPKTEEALRDLPLLRAPKTYNPDHPDYDPALVRNFPGALQNGEQSAANPALRAIRQVMQASETNGRAWPDQLEMAFAEIKTIPGAEQLFRRKANAEHFFLDANNYFDAHYQPGWVNLDDGLFLYWLIRRLRPRIVVETGVCNGFSSGIILLALAKNGNEGKLHAIGRAEIFDPGDPRWISKGKIFGEVIVTGQSLGWMVPDSCRNAVEFHVGEAQTLLPQLVDKVDSIDLFFHDSDHSYDHMSFEFETAKRKLSPRGAVAANNIAWNSSLWDFADNYGTPAYNFLGSVGAAFFG